VIGLRAVACRSNPAASSNPLPSSLDLSASYLVANFAVSGVGFVLFSYGRKMSRTPQVVIGLLLMVFPYFVPNVLVMLTIATLLCGLLYLAIRSGY
jgi:hypothetical protein